MISLIALATACPILAGTYTNCVFQDGSPVSKLEQVVISQQKTNDVDVYEIMQIDSTAAESTETFVADNLVKAKPILGETWISYQTDSCEDSRVRRHVKSVAIVENSQFIFAEFTKTFAIQGTHLHLDSVSTLGASPEMPLSTNIRCELLR